MAGIYDVHAHLNDELYAKNKLESVETIKQSKKMGIDIINIVGINVASSKVAIRQAMQHNNIYATVGIHPNEVNEAKIEDLDEISQMANSQNVVAVGEVGLDYSRTDKYRDRQIEFFEKQVKIAQELNLPVMVHLRDKHGQLTAYEDALKILKEVKPKKVMIHGFEGSVEMAQQFLDLGYLLSFNGKITYGSHQLEKVVKLVSLNQILLESDAPYYAPVPYEKEINYPRNTNLVAEKIAQIKKIDVDEIISATRKNGQNFFNLNH